jgi:hypothetical protein
MFDNIRIIDPAVFIETTESPDIEPADEMDISDSLNEIIDQ